MAPRWNKVSGGSIKGRTRRAPPLIENQIPDSESWDQGHLYTMCRGRNPPPPRTEKISNSAPPLMVFPGSATESGTICENGSIVELFSKNGTLKQAIIWTWKWLHCRAFSATLYSFTEDLSFVIQLVFRVCEIMIRSSWMIKREISNTDSKICRKTERKCPSTPSYHDNYVLLALLVNSY